MYSRKILWDFSLATIAVKIHYQYRAVLLQLCEIVPEFSNCRYELSNRFSWNMFVTKIQLYFLKKYLINLNTGD